jgi:hypothetical protein
MMLAGGPRDEGSMLSVSCHIINHMWFPMIVGQDEKEHTWMDEGLATFHQTEAIGEYWNAPEVWDPGLQPYYRLAGTGFEVESMRHGDLFPIGTNARGLDSYNKPSVFLHALRSIVGNELFDRAMREYAVRWAYRHPTPFDLFNTFEDITGRDLDWFWRPAFFETWTLDQAIDSVGISDEALTVYVRDLGLIPMPTTLTVTYSDGRVESASIPVQHWLSGEIKAEISMPAGYPVHVVLDPSGALPDIDRSNNTWTTERPARRFTDAR